ncbi:MAG: DUF2971 domain-containing protein [Sphingomonas sp.]|nr:DUF2971 domain-containing protein [Sphingomonas sp.]
MTPLSSENMQAPKIADFPEHFFKYRALDTEQQREWVKRTLLNNEIYWAAPASFNDPFDCAPIYEVPPRHLRGPMIHRVAQAEGRFANRAERRRRERQLARMPNNILEAGIDNIKTMVLQETAVYSLASAADEILMWSHYSGAHTGISLRFRPRPLLRTFNVAFPVRYTPDRPTVMIGLDERTELLQKMLLTKADIWSYEQEWRFVGWREGPGPRQFQAGALDGIILGERISAANEELVRRWVAARTGDPIEVLRATLDPHLFQLQIRP